MEFIPRNGERGRGEPTIGNEVWIGSNAVIIGSVSIGDDIGIAPNSYGNCDAPSRFVVFRNLCIIKNRENVAEDDINNKI